jgi:RNA polymerase sigma-70 factor (ECF subfamily)
MHGLDRKVFLAIRVDEMRYPEIAEKFDISVAEVEKHFAASLRIMMIAMDEKDPWWWRFRLW